MKTLLLIVDDDEGILELAKFAFSAKEYAVTTAESLCMARRIIESYLALPDIILLDVNLPDGDGLDFLRFLKSSKKYRGIPILLMTAFRTDSSCIVEGLRSGAADYVLKPFDIDVLIARVEVALRWLHYKGSSLDVFSKSGVKLNAKERTVCVEGKLIRLTPKEFNLFYALLYKSPEVVDKNELLLRMDTAGGESMDAHIVDEHMYQLKKKLGAKTASRIKTIHGTGYKFE